MKLIIQGEASPALLQQIASASRGSAIITQSPQAWRINGVRVDAASREQVRSLCNAAACDFAFVQDGLKLVGFKLLAMDMDSTLINIECIDEIADAVGKKAEVAAITEAAMRGEITDFADSLRRRVALLKGVPASALEAVYEQRLQLNPGAEQLLSAAKAAGLKTLLVSGGFTFFTERLKARLGLDYAYANTLEISNGVLTGHVSGPIVDGENKKLKLAVVADQISVNATESIAIGDGSNDLPMMSIAGLSVAYHAKPRVQHEAMVAINHGGLDAVLQLFE